MEAGRSLPGGLYGRWADSRVDADAFYAAVDGDGNYKGNVVAFGVSTAKDGSVAVAAVSAQLQVDKR